ncbi:hypothetical protein BDV23DRAFT_45997 [Aspergillus alliaceus]|uniref:Secreted peptide n=1 Tax=Petromyces alliaceus TaxID=209559 RepID=A0A5N7CPT7_PETAA|nr:hypothetical protein BDV23DRAFT_45997 [Aspergillus alliaceus]
MSFCAFVSLFYFFLFILPPSNSCAFPSLLLPFVCFALYPAFPSCCYTSHYAVFIYANVFSTFALASYWQQREYS